MRPLSTASFNEAPREPTDDEIAAAVARTPDFPPFNISKKYFDQQFCKCLRNREAGKCDCKLCACGGVPQRAR